MHFTLENIPHELKELNRWVLWKQEPRKGKLTKIPKQSNGNNARMDSEHTWCDFEHALNSLEQSDNEGVGFVLGAAYVGVDIDKCYDPETGEYKNPFIQEIIEELPGYKEYSPSGKGVHIILYLPDLLEAESFIKARISYSIASKTGFKKEGLDGVDFEVYWTNRYFTMTGKVLPDSEEFPINEPAESIEHFSAILVKIAKKYGFYKDRVKSATVPQQHTVTLTDQEVIEKAGKSKNGKKILDLWQGVWEPHRGEDGSQSSADLSFLNHLAYWTGKDTVQMERIFRNSGLYREEKGDHYINLSIQKAIEDFIVSSDDLGAEPIRITDAPTVEPMDPTTTPPPVERMGSLKARKEARELEEAEEIEEPLAVPAKIEVPTEGADNGEPEDESDIIDVEILEGEVIDDNNKVEIPKIYIQICTIDNEIIDREYVHISNEAFQVLVQQDPRNELLFVKNNELGVLKKQEETIEIDNSFSQSETMIKFKPLDKHSMKGILNRVAQYYKIQRIKTQDDGYILKDKLLPGVPAEVAADIFHHQDYRDLPTLRQILARPVINKRYEILSNDGYDPETGFYLDGNKLPVIHDYTLIEAIEILEEWLQDFSWKTAVDFANALSLGLTLLIRSALPYGVLPPLFLITSANPGSGKSTLANIIGIAVTGNVPGATSISNDEEEMRKHLASEAMAGSEYVVFDNAKKGAPIDCGVLASAVTEPKLRNRILGHSEIEESRNNLTVCFTGNGLQVSSELVDRGIFIELQEDVRAGDRIFATDTIVTDTIKRRDELYSAFYTLFRVWRDNHGAYLLDKSKHRQKMWCKMIGAILESVATELEQAGELYKGDLLPNDFRGLGENYAQHKIDSDPEFEAMSTLVRAIEEIYPVGVEWAIKDIFHFASYTGDGADDESEYNILGDWIRASKEGSRKNDVGRFIKERVGQVFGSGEHEYKIIYCGKRQNRNHFTLAQNSEAIEG